MSDFTVDNAFETIRSMEDYNNAPNVVKCSFLHYVVYGYVNQAPPDYLSIDTAIKDLENHFWTKSHALAKRYIHRLSGKISNRVYKMSEAGSQSSDIAIQFYFSLLHAALPERCSSLAEIYFDFQAEQERQREEEKDQ